MQKITSAIALHTLCRVDPTQRVPYLHSYADCTDRLEYRILMRSFRLYTGKEPSLKRPC